MRFKVKVWACQATVDCAQDWFLHPDDLCDLSDVVNQPYRIAAVPVMFDANGLGLDLSQFDLVLLSDVEYCAWWKLDAWIKAIGIKNWLLAQGSVDWQHPEPHQRVVYRPWWIWHRDLAVNHWQDTNSAHKPYRFDCMLGSRRPNRDFVMLSLQKYDLLEHNIVTYRDIFPGAVVEPDIWPVQEYFPKTLNWPYVSSNLDPDWEVSDKLDNSISELVPWHIYRQTWFSIVCESVAHDPVFFMAEKISKPMIAGRAFVHFGTQGFLRQLRRLGYETFHPVIDESYDDEHDAWQRWRMAFEQVRRLHELDATRVIQILQHRLEHNRAHLQQLGSRMRQDMHALLRRHVPDVWLLH